MGRKFTDNALTTLATAINAAAQTLAVATGKGDNFPAVTGRGVAGQTPDYFVITMESAAGLREKIRVEQRAAANDTLGSVGYPLIRGYDGTVAQSWAAGDSVDLRWDKSEATDADDKVQAGGRGREFGYKASTTAGLNYGYYGANLTNDGVAATIADGTVLLTASQTNYVERTPAGVVSANIVGFSADKIPMALVVTDAGGISAITDKRTSYAVLGRLAKSVAGGVDVTLTAEEAKAEIIELTGLLTASINVIFPTMKRSWTVVNSTTGAFAVTCKTAAGTGKAVSQTRTSILYGDGTNIGASAEPSNASTSIPEFLLYT